MTSCNGEGWPLAFSPVVEGHYIPANPYDPSEVLANDDPPYPMKASHATEMPLKFDHRNLTGLLGNRPERMQAAANMSHAGTSFARNSDPNFEGLPHWLRYTLENRETMFINARCEVVNDPDSEERKLWAEP